MTQIRPLARRRSKAVTEQEMVEVRHESCTKGVCTKRGMISSVDRMCILYEDCEERRAVHMTIHYLGGDKTRMAEVNTKGKPPDLTSTAFLYRSLTHGVI